jgi:hypothetical protein
MIFQNLAARLGDTITVAFYEPDSSHRRLREE